MLWWQPFICHEKKKRFPRLRTLRDRKTQMGQIRILFLRGKENDSVKKEYKKGKI